MNEIIKISKSEIGGTETNSVNARDIYKYLEVKTAFTTWLQRAIDKYDFTYDDFFSYLKESTGGRREKEFIVSIDMAKELCMITDTPKGKEVRKYFIEVEKQAARPLSITDQIQLMAQGHIEIEGRVKHLEATKRLEAWQEKSLHDAKNKKVYSLSDDPGLHKKLHRKVWGLFKKKFNLPRYNELPSVKFNDGLEYIGGLNMADMVN